MSNAKNRDKAQAKQGDFHGKFQALLLVSSLIGAVALVVVAFLNTAQPAGAQSSNGRRIGDAAAVVAPGIVMTHTMTGTMTGTGVVTDSMNMTHTTAAPDAKPTGASAAASTATATLDHGSAHAAHVAATSAATSTIPTITPTLTTRPEEPLTATLALTRTTTTTPSAAPTITVTQAATTTAAVTASAADNAAATVTPAVAVTEAVTEAVTATAPTATNDGGESLTLREDIQALMDDTLLLVRSHVVSMQRQLADNPTAEEVAAMNTDMQALTRMMQRLITMAQRETAGGVPAVAEVPTLTAPAMGAMPGMNTSGVAATPVAPATASGSTAPVPTQSDVEAKLQAVSALMLEARQQMQTMMTDGATDAEIGAMRAKLEELRYRMRELMAEMQAAAGPAPATLDSPIAGAASAAAAGSGMGDMMQGMSGMMENMSSMMDSMMGGMMGGSGSNSMSGMPSTSPAAGAAPAPSMGATSTDASALVRSAEAGGVTVTVLPLNLGATNATTLDFSVTVDTHTAALDQNLATVSVLQPPMGGELVSIQWNGPTGGHHVEGTLSFPRTDTMGMAIMGPGTLTLVLRNYAGVAERTFAWDLGQ